MYVSVILSNYLMFSLLFSGIVSIEQIQTLSLNTSSRRATMDNYQLPLPTFSGAYLDLIDENNELVRYFHLINPSNIYPVIKKCYSDAGPQGYS